MKWNSFKGRQKDSFNWNDIILKWMFKGKGKNQLKWNILISIAINSFQLKLNCSKGKQKDSFNWNEILSIEMNV